MAGNILGRSLPRATSQASVISPVRSAPKGSSALSDFLQAAPGLANTFLRANQIANQEEARQALNTQKAEDSTAIASAITARNDVLMAREEAAGAENDLQGLALSWSQATADGEISEQDNTILQDLQASFAKTKTAQAQGLFNSSQTGSTLRILQNSFVANNPHLATEADKLFSIDKNARGSTVSGAAAKSQLDFNRRMENKYGINYTLDNVVAERSKMAASDDLKRNAALGKSTFEGISEQSSLATNLGIDHMMNVANTLYAPKQGLTRDEQDQLLAQSDQMRRGLINDMDKAAAELRAQGIGTVDSTTRESAKEKINAQFLAFDERIRNKDLMKTLTQRNKLSDELYKAQIGNKVTRLNSALDKAGDGVLNAVTATILNKDPQQERILVELARQGGTTTDQLESAKSIIIEAAERAVNPTPTPGFEKMDAYFGISSIQRGPVAPVVFKNTLRSMSKLVNTPKDAGVNIDTVNDPKYSINASKQSPDELREFRATTQGWEAQITNEVESKELTVNIDPVTGELVAFKQQAVPAGERFGQGQSTLDVPTSRRTVNLGLSRDLNKILSLHRNPDYLGVLQEPDKWLQEILFKFSPATAEDLPISE